MAIFSCLFFISCNTCVVIFRISLFTDIFLFFGNAILVIFDGYFIKLIFLMRIALLFLSLVALAGFISCDSELDVNADWKPIPVVYCVLDQSQPIQYVKVTKAFLGDVPASVMAQISDSLFYEHVDVKLYEKSSPSNILVATFEQTDEIPRDSGYFANDRNTLYKSDVILNSDKEYILYVHIDDIPVDVYNSIPVKLIDGCSISKPDEMTSFINIVNYNTDFTYEYRTGENGKIYQMVVKFNYLEVRGTDTSENTLSIVWPQPVRVDSLQGTAGMIVKRTFSNLAFYNLISTSIPTSPGVKRLVKMPDSMEFQLIAADNYYYTYMQVSQPSTGLAQSKPLFTNFTNGIGLFATRFNTTRIKKMGERTLDSLCMGIYTYDKGFVYHTDPYYAAHF